MKNQTNRPSRALNIGLWLAQIILAAMFLMAGFMKTAGTAEELAAQMPAMQEFPLILVRFIGIAEILGAVGLILPVLLNIKPKLTVYAALGILCIMVLGFLFHLLRAEYASLPMNIALAALAAFVARGRSAGTAPAAGGAVSAARR